MLNNTATEAKYNVTIPIDGTTGIKGDFDGLPCFAETTLKFEVFGVGPTNVIEIHWKLRNSPNWRVLTSITGAVVGTVDISTVDFIRYAVTTADGVGDLYASGYMLSSVSASITGGDASAANQVTGNNYLASINNKTFGSLLPNGPFDDIQVAYPTSSTETYAYYYLGSLLKTVEITYSDATKRYLTRTRNI